ncbi:MULTISPECIES: ABC transporter permease [unclassified Neorhizobium]|uniref:ABC transporter permease n=1 Tax=unclassified Neorhizobium TaxID=2629175 RepID=UPI001FF3FCC2|nr:MULTISPECIES: ABC transporter permease [unclassified Neorhizobium]MCJ9669628.1 ABC transporter permease [Neorhizobium sp. SHOUNA12B]MCJ9746005.1 ABC transporter permease [Neorhizobium sp. SHOUNA12A]
MAVVTADIAAPSPAAITKSPGFWSGVLRRISRDPVAMSALAILMILVLIAIFAPYIAPYDPSKGSVIRRLKPIGTQGYIFGTDELGRDMLSRLIYGARLSLIMGVIPVPVAFIIGSTIGIVAGYAGGIVNTLIMRTVDVFYAFPSVLLAVALSGALGSGLTNALVSLTVVFIPQIARVAESVTTQVRKLDYVDAARASGAPPMTIIRVHILGNVLGPIFVFATSLISVSMILASGLSFLGLGVRPPDAEWGLMLNTLRTAIYNNPFVAALPGLMIFITSICFNLFSDGLRTAMDVKS